MTGFRCLVESSSDQQMTCWATIATPKRANEPEVCTLKIGTREFVAVRGWGVGSHSRIWHAYVTVPPVGPMPPPATLDLEQTAAPWAFHASSWVLDDPEALDLQLGGRIDGVDITSTRRWAVESVFQSSAVQVYRLTKGLPATPLVCTLFMYVYHGQDVVELEGVVTNSTPHTAAKGVQIDSLWLRSGEYLHVDFASRFGFSNVWQPNEGTGVWHTDLVQTPLELGYAQELDFRGALLCIDNSRPLGALIRDPSLLTRLQNLFARTKGRVSARCEEWAGEWLAFGAVESHQDARPRSRETQRWALSPGSITDDRPKGSARNANITGAQADFGATKQAELLHGELWTQPAYLAGLSEPLRPIHYLEADGSIVQKQAHPEWWTWAQQTHVPSVSPDQLVPSVHPSGKGHAYGWTGKDDQHLSSNHLHGALAVTGSFLLERWVQQELENQLANTRFGPQPGGAPRAIGRRLLFLANAYRLTGERRVWDACLDVAVMAMAERPASSGDLQPLGLGNDPRLLTDPDGTPVDTVVVWEHGLAAIGLAAACAVAPDPGLEQRSADLDTLQELTADAIMLVAEHGFFVDPSTGTWSVMNLLRWQGGQPLPSSVYVSGGVPGWTAEGGPGWFDWTYPGVRWLARAGLGSEGVTSRYLGLKPWRIADELEGQHAAAGLDRIDWWATV